MSASGAEESFQTKRQTAIYGKNRDYRGQVKRGYDRTVVVSLFADVYVS